MVVLGLAQHFGRPDFDELVDAIAAKNVRFGNMDFRDAFVGLTSAMRMVRKITEHLPKEEILKAVNQLAANPPDALRVALSEGCWHLVRTRLEAVCGRAIIATQVTDLDTESLIRFQHKLCRECCTEASIPVNGQHHDTNGQQRTRADHHR